MTLSSAIAAERTAATIAEDTAIVSLVTERTPVLSVVPGHLIPSSVRHIDRQLPWGTHATRTRHAALAGSIVLDLNILAVFVA